MPKKTKKEIHVQVLVPVKTLHSNLSVDHVYKNLNPGHKPSTGRFVPFGRTIHESPSKERTSDTTFKVNHSGHQRQHNTRPRKTIITNDQRTSKRENMISDVARKIIHSRKPDIYHIQTESDLMKAKAYINQQMMDCIARWEEHNNFKLENMLQQEKDNLFFPPGFGFHLVDERAYSKEKEPEFSKLYDEIMRLDDTETQDLLLCFLDDFKMKREALKHIDLQRSNLLGEVQRWMAKTRLKHDVKGLSYKYALECDSRLSERYSVATQALEKMKKLRMDIRNDRRRKPPGPKEPRSPSQTKVVAECVKKVPMVIELLNILKENKDEINEYECEEMVELTEDLVKCMVTLETEIAKTVTMIKNKKFDIQLINSKQRGTEKVLVELKLKLDELESKPFHQRLEVKKTKPLSNALVQTERTALPPRRVRHPSKQTQKWAQKISVAMTELLSKPMEIVDTAVQAAVSEGQMAPTSIVDKTQSTLILAMPDRLKDEPIEVTRYRRYATALEPCEDSLPNAVSSSGLLENITLPQLDKVYDTAEERQKVLKAKQVRKKKVTVQVRAQDTRVTLSTQLFRTKDLAVVEEEESGDLLGMTQKLCENMLKHLKSLQSTLIRYRQDARKELQGIEAKEKKVVELSKTIKNVLAFIDTHPQQLPIFQTTDDKVDVKYRHRPLHKCRFCTCHQDVPAVTLDSKATAEAVGKTLDHCQAYVGLIAKVKLRYGIIINQLVETQSFLWKGLNDMLWSTAGVHSKGSEFANLDPVVDEEIKVYIKMLETAVEKKEDLADAMEQARDLITAVKNMTVHVLKIIGDTKERLKDVKEQNDFLCSVEEQLDRAGELLQLTMVEVCQLRSRQDVLVTGRMVKECRCRYCRCYNSPLGDGMRSMMKDSTHHVALSTALSAIVQGLATVEVKLYNEDGSPNVLCALKPVVLTSIDESRMALLRCLGVAFHVKLR